MAPRKVFYLTMSSFSRQFFLGIKSHATAYQLIKEHGLWSFFIWPILLSFLILWAGAEAIDSLATGSIDYIKSLIWDEEKPDGFWAKSMYYFVWFLFKILFVYTYYLVNKYLVFIILSPVLAIMSERVDRKITGRDFKFSVVQLYKDVLRGIAIALRNLFMEYSATLILLLVSVFIPVLAPLYPIAIFFIASYFYGFAFLDYNSERYRLSFKESVTLIRKNFALAVGLGTVFSLFFLIPIFGGIIAPVLSCVAATVVYIKEFRPLSTQEKIEA